MVSSRSKPRSTDYNDQRDHKHIQGNHKMRFAVGNAAEIQMVDIKSIEHYAAAAFGRLEFLRDRLQRTLKRLDFRTGFGKRIHGLKVRRPDGVGGCC